MMSVGGRRVKGACLRSGGRSSSEGQTDDLPHCRLQGRRTRFSHSLTLAPLWWCHDNSNTSVVSVICLL